MSVPKMHGKNRKYPLKAMQNAINVTFSDSSRQPPIRTVSATMTVMAEVTLKKKSDFKGHFK